MTEVDFNDLLKIEIPEDGGQGGKGNNPPNVKVWDDKNKKPNDKDEQSKKTLQNQPDDKGGQPGQPPQKQPDDKGGQPGDKPDDKGGQPGDKPDDKGGQSGNKPSDKPDDKGKEPSKNPEKRGDKGASGDEANTEGETLLDILKRKQEALDKHLTLEDKPVLVKLPSNASDRFKPNEQGSKTLEQIRNENKNKNKIAIDNAKETIEQRTGKSDVHLPDSFDRSLLQPQFDWRNLLKRFFKTGEHEVRTWSRLRKGPLAAGYPAASSNTVTNEADIVVAIDTSGSISDEMVKIFISEIIGIAKIGQKKDKILRIRILYWNTSVYLDVLIDTTKTNLEQIKNELLSQKVKSGGTRFNCIKEYLVNNLKNKKKLSGFVVFTDGDYFGDESDNLDIPSAQNKLALLTPDGKNYPLDKYFNNIYKIDVFSK